MKLLRTTLALGLALTTASMVACSATDSGNAQQKPTDNAGIGAGQGMVNTKIDGVPAQGSTVNADSLSLSFAIDGDLAALGWTLVGFQCRLGGAADFTPCSGAPFVISGLRNGEEYTLAVRAELKDAAGNSVFATEAVSTFRIELVPGMPGSQGGVTADSVRALSKTLQVGNAYVVNVPEGLHVTEYSSSKTPGFLSFFRILPDADPYYLNNFNCARDWDRTVASIAPAGQALMYCHSTPTQEAYKNDHEYRLAYNHVELATDTNLVAADNAERLSVAVYDRHFEWMAARSRFRNACMNSEIKSRTVPMVNDFFLGHNPEEVTFHFCDTYQPDMDGSPVLWRVGAFVDIDQIDWACNDCTKAPRAVEAVYMVRANGAVFTPELFARQAQERMLDVLKKLTP